MMITEAEIWDQLFRLADRVQPIVTKYTVCLHGWQDELRSAGTGVLLRIAERHFLLSAAHVIDFAFYHSIPLVTYTSAQPDAPIPLQFLCRDSSARPKQLPLNDSDLRDQDPCDFSVAELAPACAEELSERKRFLQLGDLDPSPLKKAAGVFVFGYPSATIKRGSSQEDMEVFPLGYTTTPLQIDPEPRDKDKDILLYYPEVSSDTKGGTIGTPKPYGFSGCGIWRMSEPPNLPIDVRAEDVRLVGIQHRWRQKSGYLVGTSVARVIELLWFAHPELHPALRLIRRPHRLDLGQDG